MRVLFHKPLSESSCFRAESGVNFFFAESGERRCKCGLKETFITYAGDTACFIYQMECSMIIWRFVMIFIARESCKLPYFAL